MTLPEAKKFTPPFTKSLFDWWMIAGLLALAPLLAIQAKFLGERSHFQFFPIAVIFFIAMIVVHRRPTYTTSKPRMWTAICCQIAHMVLAVSGALFFSPWLAQLSAIFLCLGWMFVRLGGNPWHQLIAWASVLMIIVPPPRNFDQSLIQQLQLKSTSAASQLLDMTHVPHLPRGNILETRQKEMFVDQACSGIDSLYSLAAIALIFIIWNRQSALSSALLLLSVPAWAVFGNLLRIFTIVFVLDRFNFDLSTGWQHTLIGLVLFSVSSLGLLLTQKAIAELTKPFMFYSTGSGPLHVLYNTIVSWPSIDPTRNENRITESTLATHNPIELGHNYRSIFKFVGLATSLLVALVSSWQIVAATQDSTTTSNPMTATIKDSKVDEALTSDDLPAKWMDMSQLAFRTEHRETGSSFGEHSATWSYLDGTQPVVVSVDFPFLNIHNLDICYELSGNTIEKPISSSPMLLSTGKTVNIYQLRMKDQLQSESYTWFVMCKKNGDSPQISSDGSMFDRGLFTPRGISHSDITAQFQLHVEGTGPLRAEQVARYQKCLVDMIDRLFPTVEQVVWDN